MRIALAQLPGTRVDDWPQTLRAIENAIATAADQNADLVLLPECVWPAYFIRSVPDYFAARRQGLPGDAWFCAEMRRLAQTHRIGICAGYIAEHDEQLANAAILLDAAGNSLGTCDKCFLWDFDNDFFRPGAAIQPIATPWGKIGVLICADARLPEITATLVARGAEVILQPTAWVDVLGQGQLWNPQPDYLISERAREFHVPFASCSKWGSEGGVALVGQSAVFDARGNALVRCGARESAVVVADVALGKPAAPVLSEAERAALLSEAPPVLPEATVVELELRRASAPDVQPTDQLAEIPADSPPTLILHPTPTGSESPARATDAPHAVLAPDTRETVELAGIRIVPLAAGALGSFGPARVAALRGAHAVVVFGRKLRESLLRARATENRIFVIGAEDTRIRVWNPLGQLVAERGGGEEDGVVRIDPREAADKDFAPRTNALLSRRPALYEF